MKKTLIALAVAASAAVSGSAMAWTANGIGGSVDLGGTLTPADVVTPWEVKVGVAVNGLDAEIRKGKTEVDIPVKKAIPVLGIRTINTTAFTGQLGIVPHINYGGAVNVSGFKGGVTTVTLDIAGNDGAKIGKMSADFLAAAGISRSGQDNDSYSAYAYEARGFTGGLGNASEKVLPNLAEVLNRVNALDSEISANFDKQGQKDHGTWRASSFNLNNSKYSAFYGSGIEQGKTIKITLDQAVSGDAPIQWKASLPVTISYQ
ncbi:hypothetical protein ACH19I_17450 [Yersinia kristensenii]|uniref:F4 family fimbrial subunit n=1 Tax=Yersinia kristensenii TaxID=28152 RepID=UPI003896C6A4